MHHNYRDITSRIAEQPKWHDQNGVPRYDEFKPDDSPNIYSVRVVLLEIACQDCGHLFKVEMHYDRMDQVYGRAWPDDLRSLHYGDPPAHGCVGDTMNCADLRLLEVWRRDRMQEWVRVPADEQTMFDVHDEAITRNVDPAVIDQHKSTPPTVRPALSAYAEKQIANSLRRGLGDVKSGDVHPIEELFDDPDGDK